MINPNVPDEDQFNWKDLAACKGMTPKALGIPPEEDWFFDGYESNKKTAVQVDQICLSCPVQAACYDEGVSTKSEGVWGGVYLNAQGRPDLAHNNHKTPDIWKAIEEKIGINPMRRGSSSGG